MGKPVIITPSLILEVEELREQGFGTRRIAEAMHISRHTVGRVIRQHLVDEM